MYRLKLSRVALPLFLFCAAISGLSAEKSDSTAAKQGVQVIELTNRVRVEIDGKLFTEYYFKDVSKQYCYPVIGPGGEGMTRNWPMKDTAGEEHDHPHHHSLWFGHGNVSGVDFWIDKPSAGKTVHESFLEISSGKKQGVIRSKNKWISKDGAIVANDDRTLRFSGNNKQRIIDYEITLIAETTDIKMGDTKEGTMAIRIAETMRLSHGKDKPGEGHIVNSEGVWDNQTWGKRAAWVDYHGPVEGKTVGIAMFDHPKNPQYPTWWHVRDYGLFAANPFGVHDFEKKLPGTGTFVIPAGKRATYRYRMVFHEGDEKQAGIAHLAKTYATE